MKLRSFDRILQIEESFHFRIRSKVRAACIKGQAWLDAGNMLKTKVLMPGQKPDCSGTYFTITNIEFDFYT